MTALLISATLFVLSACGAADEGAANNPPAEEPGSSTAALSCTPSFSRTCGAWSRCGCIRVELGSGNCLEYAQYANCTDYYLNYDCSTTTIGPRTVKRGC